MRASSVGKHHVMNKIRSTFTLIMLEKLKKILVKENIEKMCIKDIIINTTCFQKHAIS